jgi:hypothetical protein
MRQNPPKSLQVACQTGFYRLMIARLTQITSQQRADASSLEGFPLGGASISGPYNVFDKSDL